MNTHLRRNITVAAALTPAALLAACSSWNSQSYATRDNQEMNRSGTSDPYGDGVSGGPGYYNAENRLARGDNQQHNYYSTTDNSGNVTRFDNDNRQDNSSSRYNTGVSRNENPADGTLNNQNLAKGTVQQLPPRVINQNDPNWSDQNSGQYQANQGNWNQNNQPGRYQANQSWNNQSNQPNQSGSSQSWNNNQIARNDRNASAQDSSRVAAAQAIADPSTNPSNSNAQIGATNPTRSDEANMRRNDDRMAAAGQSQQNYAANTNPDARILSILHVKNQEEIEIGRLANLRGSDAAVREYGEMLVRDHTSADSKVRSVASQENITLMSDAETQRLLRSEKSGDKSASKAADNSAANSGRDAEKNADDSDMQKRQSPIEELRSLNGAEFDRVFAEKMAKGHAKLIAEVEKAQKQVRSEPTKQLLTELLPTLKMHERLAKELPGYTETASAR
ncbi:MAG: DUF4142 domain-containing protein [Phycisphaeraceae bacterium]|nr:DUF4142 domain-containing protein [Phycisphaeraceae bacterium]